MVFSTLLRKYLYESMGLGIALAIVLFVFPWVRIWTVSQFELSGFAPLIEQFRAFEKFSPVPLEQFLTYQGMIGLTFDEPVLLLCMLAWSIARGSDVVSGELGRGTMEMLLAQPVRRWQLLAAHAVVAVSGLAVLSALVYAGMALGIWTNTTPQRPAQSWVIPWIQWNVPLGTASQELIWTPLSDLVDPSLYLAPTINLFALGFAVLGLSVMISSFDQYRWRAIGVVLGIYVLQLLLFVLAKSTPQMSFLKPFTFLAAYQPDWMVQTLTGRPELANNILMPESMSWDTILGPLGYTMLLLTVGVVSYLIACWKLETRDLPAPQ
jgi:ABC-2 type transport system permease protein